MSPLFFELYGLRRAEMSYALSPQAETLLTAPNEQLAQSLAFNPKDRVYDFNIGYQPGVDVAGQTGKPKFTASFNQSPEKGITVSDPVTQTSATLTPEFDVGMPVQVKNRLIYPLQHRDGVKVYTLQASGFKEDIILNKFQGNEQTFTYKLGLAEGTEARLETDGSLAIYGAAPALLGNVSAGTDKDQELLKKARQSAQKDTLLFTFPAPFIREAERKATKSRAWFSLKGDELTVHAAQLDRASYPLSIDPSVYVETAAKLMRGNNESNIDFDVTNELIQKGKLTGARFDAWAAGMSLPAARWDHGTAVAGGYIYVVGGSSGSTAQSTVYWAKFDPVNKDIDSPNPGAGVCTNWCTDSAYNLPAARTSLSLVAYNGYLYALGGIDSGGTRSNSVYIAKLGANGEPSRWHPTDTNPNNWVYWYTAANLNSERAYAAAVAHNNRMYLLGGQTTASTGGVTTIEKADISPIGTLGTWSATGLTALPSARHNHGAHVYNDRMYLVGGNSSGTLQSSVQYIKLNNDGTMTGNWVTTTAFGTARMAWGGNFSTILGGYLYVAGGCTALTSGNCSAGGITGGDSIQLASINADGSVTDWGTIASVTSGRIGYGLVSWQNTMYGIGGCTAHNTTNGTCTTTATATNYGIINQDGDASTVSNSVAAGTAPCSGGGPFDCDIPLPGDTAGLGGRMSGGAIVNNGYIYIIGGCTDISGTEECAGGTGMSGNVSYAALAVDGTIVRPATCVGTFAGPANESAWCVDSTNRLNGTAGLGAFAYAVFNNTIYVYGGTDGSDWQSSLWRTTINANGSINAWSTAQTAANLNLGTARGYSYMFTRSNPASAGTYPGNLYIIGGCRMTNTTDNGIGCQTYYNDVVKCNITTTGAVEEADANDCDEANQLQVDSEPGGAADGLGLMAGFMYANYIYLVGGSSPNSSERGEVMYARIDNNNDIVAVSGGIWTTSPNELNPVRRRGFAFGYNGYLYALAGYNGASSLNDLLFAKIDVSNGSIGTFKESTVTVNPRWDLRAIVSSGYVYAFGGCSTGAPAGSCTALTGTIQTFQLYNNYSGTPAGYTALASGSDIAQAKLGGGAAVLNGYLYVVGGCTVVACGAASTTTQYAQLNNDGSIGTWQGSAANDLPGSVGRGWAQLETVGGTLYLIGGINGTGTPQTSVFYATPTGTGSVTWATATNGIPAARWEYGATVWNGRIYVTGGASDAAGTTITNTVYASPDLSSGGNIGAAWTSTGMTAFNVDRVGHTAIAYAGNLYILGGYNGSQYLNDVQFAKIDPTNGTVGSWSYSTSLPQRIRDADGFAANGYMYLFGGRSATSTCTSNTYIAPISANTTIASGNNPTGLGEWYQTNVRWTQGDRFGAMAAYSEGRAYLLGGGCSAMLTAGNRTLYTSLQSQPQLAKYSRMIDTDTDVFPTKWLMNGLDNSTGARWFMRYRSSTASTAAWGQETNYGAVTLGTAANYLPLDGSGANTNFARYYYMSVNIDSSQAFGYPEDVERGPTINDLSIFFSSDPSKRLRHGKTFTGGEQQPYDTPF